MSSTKRPCSKERRELFKRIVAAGGELRLAKSGHWKVYVNGVLKTTVAATPSDYRGRRNELANLRRCGLDL